MTAILGDARGTKIEILKDFLYVPNAADFAPVDHGLIASHDVVYEAVLRLSPAVVVAGLFRRQCQRFNVFRFT